MNILRVCLDKVSVLILGILLSLPSWSEVPIYFIHNDHLGTPQMLTDMDQKVVWQVESQTPFGETMVNEDPDGDGQTVEFNVRAPGQYYDKETGLNYNYFRYYDPTTGRYITSDPIGLAGGINTYAYVGGNPLSWIDPYGLAGTIVIHSSGNGGSSMMSGHSWITFTPVGGTTTTYGTWGNNPRGLGNGLHINLSTGRTGNATRSAFIDDGAEAKLFALINQYQAQGSSAWSLNQPCSGFATNAWNTATGGNLSCQWGPICNPTTLMNSIINANGGVNHSNTVGTPGNNSGNSSLQSSGASSGYISIWPFGSLF